MTKLLRHGECLIVEIDGCLLAADSFSREENAVHGDRFCSVTVGQLSFRRDFPMNEVLYLRYGSGTETCALLRLEQEYEELSALAWGKYRRTGGRKGILRLKSTDSGDEKYKEKRDNLMNNRFRNYFNAENAVLSLPNGMDYQENKDAGQYNIGQLSDVTALVKEAVVRAAQAFHIPPALLLGETAGLENAVENFLSFGLNPLCELLETELNRKRFGRKAWLQGSFVKVDPSRAVYQDLFSVSSQADKLISSGLYSIDELRRKTGGTQLGTDWASRHWMTKNYSDIEAADRQETPAGKGDAE